MIYNENVNIKFKLKWNEFLKYIQLIKYVYLTLVYKRDLHKRIRTKGWVGKYWSKENGVRGVLNCTLKKNDQNVWTILDYYVGPLVLEQYLISWKGDRAVHLTAIVSSRLCK